MICPGTNAEFRSADQEWLDERTKKITESGYRFFRAFRPHEGGADEDVEVGRDGGEVGTELLCEIACDRAFFSKLRLQGGQSELTSARLGGCYEPVGLQTARPRPIDDGIRARLRRRLSPIAVIQIVRR